MSDIRPSDVQDGDLLSGTLYGNPFTDWPVTVQKNRHRASDILFIGSGLYLNEVTGPWRGYVTVTSCKPAPKPLLPWEEHPDWYFRQVDGDGVLRAEYMHPSDDPADFKHVLVVPADTHVAIPRELIEAARDAWDNGDTTDTLYTLRQILDAAGGVS